MTTTNKFVFVFVFAQRVPISERCGGRVELSWNLGNGRIPCSGTNVEQHLRWQRSDNLWVFALFSGGICTSLFPFPLSIWLYQHIFSICTYLSQIGIVTFFGRSAMCTLFMPFPNSGWTPGPLSRSYGLPFLDIWTLTDALNWKRS